MSSTPSRPLVVGVAGSLNDGSVTRKATECALAAARQRGARTELLDLREYDLPAFDPNATPPADVEALTDRIEAADAVLLGTPMYHGSYSSPLKTALDYCGFDEFDDTTVGLLAVSGGSFPLPALEHLRSVCRAFEAWVLPHQAAITDSHAIDGALPDADRERLTELGERAVAYAGIDPSHPAEQCPGAPADD
ncbi:MULTISPECIES: NADPH-dependent FMN reductase [Haloarcula]|uniref:NADPH-dependent FMN reductase n=1 Tax=Haloarcula TaxID=2237 RepID=UPI001666DBA2|nr:MULTISPECIES: NAD(P)H-dependent oxidoreductase [Halomicroarcula]MBX0349177.1 NAD(P)H-dependent oxidoreductase [Halomicroarcula pellucida]MDS0279230.1 NAD(P)H-dependent oxidoreductase [Halomicroarcula sp. S1AR25-4]